MPSIKHLFWNSTEARPRAIWRILAQILIALLIIIPLEEVTQALALEQGGMPALLLSNGIFLVGVCGSVWLAGRVLCRRPFAAFGFQLNLGWWRDFSVGLLLGVLLIGLVFAIERAAGWIIVTGTARPVGAAPPLALDILLFGLVCLAAGIAEETLYRGYWIRNLAEGLRGHTINASWGLALAVLLPTLVFAARHANNPHATAISTLNTVLGGAMFALGYVLTGELALPIGLHISWNFLLGSVLSLPVSGIRAPAILTTVQRGPDLWTGGAYGPEGGLLGTLAFFVGSVLILVWVRRHGPIELHRALSHPMWRPVADGAHPSELAIERG